MNKQQQLPSSQDYTDDAMPAIAANPVIISKTSKAKNPASIQTFHITNAPLPKVSPDTRKHPVIVGNGLKIRKGGQNGQKNSSLAPIQGVRVFQTEHQLKKSQANSQNTRNTFQHSNTLKGNSNNPSSKIVGDDIPKMGGGQHTYSKGPAKMPLVGTILPFGSNFEESQQQSNMTSQKIPHHGSEIAHGQTLGRDVTQETQLVRADESKMRSIHRGDISGQRSQQMRVSSIVNSHRKLDSNSKKFERNSKEGRQQAVKNQQTFQISARAASGRATPKSPSDYHASSSIVASACHSRDHSKIQVKNKVPRLRIRENIVPSDLRTNQENITDTQQEVSEISLRKGSKIEPSFPETARATIERGQYSISSKTKDSKFIINQDHSKYTSYPQPPEKLRFNNLHDTFNVSIKKIEKTYNSKKNSRHEDPLSKSFNSKLSQSIKVHTNAAGQKASLPVSAGRWPPHDLVSSPPNKSVATPGDPSLKHNEPSSPTQEWPQVQSVSLEDDLSGPQNRKVPPMNLDLQKNFTHHQKMTAHNQRNFGRHPPFDQTASVFDEKRSLLAQVGNSGRFKTQDRRIRAQHGAYPAAQGSEVANSVMNNDIFGETSRQTFTLQNSARDGSMTGPQGTKREAWHNHQSSTYSSTLGPSTQNGHRKKFSYLKQVDEKSNFEHEKAILARNTLGFVPYLQERTQFGQLLKGNEDELFSPQKDITVLSGQHQVRTSRFATLQPTARGSNLDEPVDELDLHKKIIHIARKKMNDPLHLTTERNLRKIKANSRQKILNQIKFSKFNSVQFKEETASQGWRTSNDASGIHITGPPGLHLAKADSVHIPEGVEQLQIPWAMENKENYTARSQAKGSLTGRTPNEASTIVTEIMQTHASFQNSSVMQTANAASVNLDKFEQHKLVEEEKQGGRTSKQEVAEREEMRRETHSPLSVGAPAAQKKEAKPHFELSLPEEDRAKKGHSHFALNLPNSRAKVPTELQSKHMKVNRPTTYQRSTTISFIKPRIFDIVRQQTKDKLKQNLKYCMPVSARANPLEKQIPEELIQLSKEEFHEYPKIHEDVVSPFAKQLPTTFGTSERFQDSKSYYKDEPREKDPNDVDPSTFFHNRNNAPQFEKYSKRQDNFLTKSQEELIRLKQEETLVRIARMQMIKEAQDKEAKEREKNNQAIPGLSSANQKENLEPVQFMPEDHYRVIEMWPHIKTMVSSIKTHARQLRNEESKGELE